MIVLYRCSMFLHCFTRTCTPACSIAWNLHAHNTENTPLNTPACQVCMVGTNLRLPAGQLLPLPRVGFACLIIALWTLPLSKVIK